MKAPYFWRGGLDPKSREAAPVSRALLTPLASLYAWGGARKLASATPTAAGVPVICVGNLTLGGSGKTPVVAAIRQLLVSQGVRAASLSRGYRGLERGPLRVNPNRHTAKDVGDEPLMLSRTGESWVGIDRPTAAQAMSDTGVDVIVMDDGHQNPSLKKDLSIIVIDTGDPFGNGHVFPKGPLREPVSLGLRRADAVILTGGKPFNPAGFDGPVLRADLQPKAPPPGGPLVAFAGIGRPDKFFDALAKAGADIAEAVPFPDHHPFTAQDLIYLRDLAADHGADLITTEKDHVRLPIDGRDEVHAWPVEAVLSPADALSSLLAPLIEARADA